jgi:hypothetical protein
LEGGSMLPRGRRFLIWLKRGNIPHPVLRRVGATRGVCFRDGAGAVFIKIPYRWRRYYGRDGPLVRRLRR